MNPRKFRGGAEPSVFTEGWICLACGYFKELVETTSHGGEASRNSSSTEYSRCGRAALVNRCLWFSSRAATTRQRLHMTASRNPSRISTVGGAPRRVSWLWRCKSLRPACRGSTSWIASIGAAGTHFPKWVFRHGFIVTVLRDSRREGEGARARGRSLEVDEARGLMRGRAARTGRVSPRGSARHWGVFMIGRAWRH